MTGQARLDASREVVWEALNNPETLQKSIPGCETLVASAGNEFTATVVSKVGPIKARFTGKVTLSNINAPRSYTLTGEGSGGAAGFARADIDVALDALEQDVTMLNYTVNANVGGKLAQLGSRMIDAAARKSADEFFELFGKQVNGRRGEAGASTSGADSAAALLGGGGGAGGAGGADSPQQRESEVLVAEAPQQQTAAPVAKPLTGTQSHDAPAAAQTASSPDRKSAATAASQSAAMDVLTREEIRIWISDGIATVTLNRPGRRNAMTHAMWLAMPTIVAALERNAEVRAIVLTGAGGDFSAGADIGEFATVRDDVQKATDYELAVDACCDAIAAVSKPTIAVLRGFCLGGGAHLAMSCDFRYAAADAVVGIPAARLSIIYGVSGTRKLLALVGLTEAKRILFGAERFDARHALRVGFVDHVAGLPATGSPRSWLSRVLRQAPRAATGDAMADARSFAALIAGNAPLSVAGAKYLLNEMGHGAGRLDPARAEALIASAAASEDYEEGRTAFGEKRKPAFKGR